jgi:Protein of unknown function (DUF3383)
MSTIPFSAVSNILPGVLSAGGNSVDLNGLVLSTSIYAPQNEVLAFANAPDAAAYFGEGSPEALFAAGYFQGPDNKTATPGMLNFLGYAENAVPGWLLGTSSTPATLAELQALSGTLIITVGGTQFTSSEINFSAVNSFSAAAAAIVAAFTSPSFTVVFDSIHQAFLITSAATGASASITFATGTLAASLGLAATSGGTLSQGANAAVPAAQMNSLIAMFQNWATFSTAFEESITEREAFSAWSASVSPRYLYVPYDEDAASSVANNPESFGGIVTASAESGTLLVYGTMAHAALVMGYAASLNFNQANGRRTLFGVTQAGLAAAVDDQTTFDAVTSNGYNVYGAFGSNNPANNSEIMTPGSVSGPFLWADSYLNQIKFNSDLQFAFFQGFQSVGQIPYNSDGDAILAGFAAGPIASAGSFGTFRKGITLSASQIQQVINLVGSDVSATITAQGYYLFTNAAGTSAEVRAQRGSPPAILLYQDGQSVQSITMPSILIQ